MTLRLTSAIIPVIVLANAPAQAQARDSVLEGRRCENRYLDLRWPAFGELADSVAITDALRIAADPGKPVTSVTARYDSDGHVDRVQIAGARSGDAARVLEAHFRERSHPLTGVAKDFQITIARLNAADHVSVLARTVTCVPERKRTPDVDQALYEVAVRASGRLRADAIVAIWLEGTGEVRHAWIERPTGDPIVDEALIRAVRAFRYEAALVGRRAVPSLIRQPVNFRYKPNRFEIHVVRPRMP